MIEKICANCGIRIETTAPGNVKYCNRCREEAKKARRESWEKRTDYKEKQRLKMKERRAKEAAEKAKNKKARTPAKESPEKPLQISIQGNTLTIEERAANGDAMALMLTVKPQSFEYWKYFKQYAIETAEANGTYSTRTVNNISVYAEHFEQDVLESIKEWKQIFITG